MKSPNNVLTLSGADMSHRMYTCSDANSTFSGYSDTDPSNATEAQVTYIVWAKDVFSMEQSLNMQTMKVINIKSLICVYLIRFQTL